LTQLAHRVCAGIELLIESDEIDEMGERLHTYGKASRASASSWSWLSMNLYSRVSYYTYIRLAAPYSWAV
jgi:hypothetical protein